VWFLNSDICEQTDSHTNKYTHRNASHPSGEHERGGLATPPQIPPHTLHYVPLASPLTILQNQVTSWRRWSIATTSAAMHGSRKPLNIDWKLVHIDELRCVVLRCRAQRVLIAATCRSRSQRAADVNTDLRLRDARRRAEPCDAATTQRTAV